MDKKTYTVIEKTIQRRTLQSPARIHVSKKRPNYCSLACLYATRDYDSKKTYCVLYFHEFDLDIGYLRCDHCVAEFGFPEGGEIDE